MRYLLGVDGGNSKTYAVVTDEHGDRLGKGLSGGGNHQTKGLEQALGCIRSSIEQAMSEANLSPAEIDFVQYGLAGADREKDFSILRPGLATLPFQNWNLVCDTMEGLRTGTTDNVGVVVVCGSGTNAAGRNRDGKTIQIGGLGELFGDEAGGNYMARETFRRTIRSWECRDEPTNLTEKVPKYLSFRSVKEMFDHYVDNNVAEVPGALTKILHEAAGEGDKLAIRILKKTGVELGIAANAVIHGLGGFPGTTIPIVLVGSVLQKGRSSYLLQSLRATVEQKYRDIEIIIPEMEPVYGAILLAMDHLGIAVHNEIYQKFIRYGGDSE